MGRPQGTRSSRVDHGSKRLLETLGKTSAKRLDFSSKLKTSIGVSLAALAATCIADVFVLEPFQGWKPLLSKSTDIVVAECDKLRTPLIVTNNGTVYTEDPDQTLDSPINVIAVLKGNSKMGPGQISAYFTPRVGERALILFGEAGDKQCLLPSRRLPHHLSRFSSSFEPGCWKIVDRSGSNLVEISY